MRSNSIPGSRFRGLLSLFALACGAALITASPGCGGGGSSLPKDAGSGGQTGTGGKVTGFGGSTPGMGGSGIGGAGTGGAGMGGSGMGGAMDAGPDVNICPDGGSAADSDGDTVPDCLDGCPNDVSKTAPGACGCGISDIDSDGDGVADCIDACPANKDLTAMGVCGCNTPVDTDHDGTPDCTDACPFDGTRTTPGACGCGIPENTPLCLVHRYSFNDTTTTIADSITIPNVSPKNGIGSTAAVVPSGGKLTLAGGASNVINGQWVTLPGGTISSLGPSATFEAWVAWTSPLVSMWQRIFDFGDSGMPAGTPGTGVTYLFLTPFGGSSVVRAALSLGGGGASEDVCNATGQLSNTGTPTFFHLAVVVDDANLRMTLYVNGQPNGNVATLRAHNILSQVNDENNWLGRSQYAPDPLFQGVYDEFRIYSKALSAAQIAEDFAKGPDVVSVLPTDGGTTTDAGAPDAPTDAPSGQ
jgi:hypothetical protein